MKYILILIFLLLLGKCQAQDSLICIPLKLANLLERDRQKKNGYEEALQASQQENVIQQEALRKAKLAFDAHHKAEAAADSTIHAKDKGIEQKDVIIKTQKNKMPWYGWPLAALCLIGGFLAGSH